VRNLEIKKSSRHQKIIGEFGEYLICNLLSRSGFEVTRIDHTGIDIIASNPETGQQMGITVKSRTRSLGKEATKVNLFKKRKGDRQKTEDACRAFSCEPWIAVYVETTVGAEVYLTSLKHYDETYCSKPGMKTIDYWPMGKRHKDSYKGDPLVKHITMTFWSNHWWE